VSRRGDSRSAATSAQRTDLADERLDFGLGALLGSLDLADLLDGRDAFDPSFAILLRTNCGPTGDR